MRSITIEDLYTIKFLSKPRISPDGEQVAYVVTTIDAQKHTYRSRIWVTSIHTGETRKFITGPANSKDPSWSPDGRWLAFVSTREGEANMDSAEKQKKRGKGKPQIWIIPTDGGEAQQLTFQEHGAGKPVWSPDSTHLLFTAQTGPADEEDDEGHPFPKARVIDQLWYRLDNVGFIYERRTHLFLIHRTGGEPQQLTDGDWDDGDAVWSPDGSHIAFASNRREDRWRLPGDDIYTLAITDGKPGTLSCLTDGTLAASSPSWSPDGGTIAFLAAKKVGSAGQEHIYTIAVNTSNAAATDISHAFEGSFADWTNSDIGDEHLAPPPAWSADGQKLYALASHRGATRLFEMPVTGASSQPATLTPGDVHVRDFTIDRAGERLALLIADISHPQEIFVCATSSSDTLQRVTHANDDFLSDLSLAQVEMFTYKGADGWPIDGWILKPHDFDPSKKYPLIVEIHGGPNTQYGYGFFHEMLVLAARGYVVLYTNPRGSLGYGYEFANAVRGAWGEKDAVDIMMGVDELVRRGYIDEQRMGVTGGSYGGFMTNWLIGHSDRFRAAVTDRCVSNMASMFGSSDIGWDLAEENLDTAPWEDLDKYMRMSPITYVQNIHTPLLIIHGEQDLRCNIEQAEQMFAALKWMGRDVRFVRFEDQSHDLSRSGHPKLRLERLQHIIDWFAKYLN